MIITFQKLGERIVIKKELLYLYLGHFSLTKHVIRSFEKKHAKVIILSQDFITDFINYLAKPRRKRKLSNEQIFLIKKELEELLKCEQATA